MCYLELTNEMRTKVTRIIQISITLSGLLGLLLLLINIVGTQISLRAPEITADYADFARPSTLTYKAAINSLTELENNRSDTLSFVTEATRIFHYGIAHIAQKDVLEKGYDYYRMRVPIWENYILYFLSYVAPSTYMDYQFCNYKKTLERATGRCGQQSMALAGYLTENGFKTGYVGLGGHSLVTTEIAEDNWVILDADFGGVIPFDLAQAEQDPASVIPYYWNQQPVLERSLHRLFYPDRNTLRIGKPELKQPTACLMESFAYNVKWLIPIFLIILWSGFTFAFRGHQSSN